MIASGMKYVVAFIPCSSVDRYGLKVENMTIIIYNGVTSVNELYFAYFCKLCAGDYYIDLNKAVYPYN